MNRIPLLMLTLAATLLVSCSRGQGTQEERARSAADLSQRLGYASLQPAVGRELITLPAESHVRPGYTYALSPPVAGKVTRLHVASGNPIKAGDPIAALQVPSLEAWREMG